MNPQKTNDRDKVFREICLMSNNIYGIGVLTSTSIADCTGLSKYKVLKALHTLRDEGLVERASMGCPAEYSGGEVEEMICEAAPPVNGWKLTAKGRKSETFRAAKDEYLKGLAEWANGGKPNEKR